MKLNTALIIVFGIFILWGLAVLEAKLNAMQVQLDTIQVQTVECYSTPTEIMTNPKLKGKTK